MTTKRGKLNEYIENVPNRTDSRILLIYQDNNQLLELLETD